MWCTWFPSTYAMAFTNSVGLHDQMQVVAHDRGNCAREPPKTWHNCGHDRLPRPARERPRRLAHPRRDRRSRLDVRRLRGHHLHRRHRVRRRVLLSEEAPGLKNMFTLLLLAAGL